MFWEKQKIEISNCTLYYFIHEALFNFIQSTLEVLVLLRSSGNKNHFEVCHETLLGFSAEH